MTRSTQIHLPTLAAIAAFASTEATRTYLHGVYVECDVKGVTYVATDGHRLAARRLETPGEPIEELIGNWIIPTTICKARKVSKRDGHGFGVLSEATDGRLAISYGGSETVFAPVDGTFPDWRRIVPEKTSGVLNLGINGAYLQSVDTFSKTLNLAPKTCHWNGENAATFTFGDDTAFVVIMPMRQKDVRPWAMPAFVSQRAA